MSFALGAFLFSLAAPPGICLWLCLLGLALLGGRYRVWGRVLVGLGLGSLYALSTGFCAAWLASGLERAPALPAAALKSGLKGEQAIVILGAGRILYAPEYDGEDVPSYWGAARLRYGADLYRATGLPLLVSGGRVFGERESEAAIMARSLQRDYVANVRWQEGGSRTTWENARLTAALLKPLGIDHIVLVTSAFHMRRSQAVFEHAGFTVLPAPTDFSDFRYFPLAMQLAPNASALLYSRMALHEYIGMGWYALKELVE